MNNEEKILAMLEKHDAMFEKQAALLDKLTSDMAEMKTDMAEMKTTQTAQGEQLAAQGEQLAAQSERLLNIEMRIENTIIPDIKALAGGHMQLPRQFHKNPRKRQPLKERRDHDRIEKREKSHERYYNEI